jgi:hypothetical protein
MNVRLDVERLILDGIDVRRGDESRLRTMVESELARLFAAEASSPRANRTSASLASVDGGVIQAGSPAATPALARYIATAVYGSLGGVSEKKP